MANLTCLNISKSFNSLSVLNNINLTFVKGECVGVLGSNGSGKSTLLNILAGTLSQSSGQVLLDNSPISKNSKISFVPQVPALFSNLSVDDNLKIWASAYGLSSFTVPDFLTLDKKKRVSSLSGGQQKKLAISIALLNNPDFLILDEAFSALDAQTVSSLSDYIRLNQDLGVIYSSHNILEIIDLCDRSFILKNGSVTHCIDQKIDFDDVKQLYEKF